MNKNLVIPKDRIVVFCKRHRIRRLTVFGCALRGDFAPDSDVDVLVEFQRGHEPGFTFFDIEAELSELIGRKVAPHTSGFLSPYFRDKVIEEAEVQYAQS